MESRFLWVDFQLKAIGEQVSDSGIEDTLRDIPKDIDSTYDRILDKIDRKPPAQRDLARKALLFVAYSRGPVLIDVLALAIAAKDHTQSLDTLRSSISTKDIILHTCGNLLSTQNRWTFLVHFSVYEFLTSRRSKFIHALSLEKEMAHREIARTCMIFLLILCSHLQDYCSDIESRFVWDYILPELPFHLLAGNLDSLSSNDEMINLTSLFFETSPPLLAPSLFDRQPDSYYDYNLCAFLPSVLALIFNLPGTYQYYNPEVLHGKQLDQKVLTWVYGNKHRGFLQVFDNRLAMHYAVNCLNSVAACQRLYTHQYPIEYSYHNSDGPLNVTKWIPQFCKLTPLYLVQSEEVARFLLDKGVGVNPQSVNSRLPNLLGHLVSVGNTTAIQFLFDHGAELEDEALDKGLVELALKGKVKDMKFLLDNGADVNAQGGEYGNALQAAVSNGHIEAVRLLLDKGADVNAQGGCYGNALQAAAERVNIEAMKLLLDKGADVNAQGGEYGNPLQAAASRGHTEAVRLLLDKGADVNAQGGKYGNALQAAAWRGNIGAVRLLLDKGADVYPQGGEYGNALQAAAWGAGGDIESVGLLLDKGADVNAQGGKYGNALQAAASEGNIESVELLLDKGADIYAQGGEYGNALQAAASWGAIETMRFLLDKGLDVNTQGGKYGNALQAAASRGHIEAIQFLLDKGADVNAQGGENGNALQEVAAAYGGYTESVGLLLNKGACVNAQGGKYGNALQAAAWRGNIEAVRLLLDKGADVYAQGGEYGNALQAAAWGGDIEIMRLLGDKGEDVNVQSGEFGNALQAAAWRGNIEAMQFLLDKGVDVNAQGGKYGTALQAALVIDLGPYYMRFKNPFHTARILLDHGADVTAYVAGSPHGDALSAAKALWRHNERSLANFMKLLKLKGWKEDKSGPDENGPQV